jgi:hypothetical protein
MAHPRDDEVYPVGTVVRLKKTGEFARIEKRIFLKDERNFLHYLGQIDGRKSGPGYYAIYHDEVDLEALPPNEPPSEVV